MRRIALTIALGFALAATAAGQDAANDDMGPALEFANAGVSISLPKGFELGQPTQPTEVIRALSREGKYGVKSVVLSAFPLPPDSKMTAGDAAEKTMDGMRGNLSMRHLRKISETTMPAGNLTGVARMISYTFRGESTVAALLFAVQQGTGVVPGICYQLNVESTDKDKDALLPLFGKVVAKLSFIAPRPTSGIPVEVLGEPIKDYRQGYSLRPPMTWSATMTQAGVMCGQFDYTRGEVVPKLQVVVDAVDISSTGESNNELWTHAMIDGAGKQNMLVKRIAGGPARMAGRDDAHQVLLLQVPQAAAVATQPETSSEAMIIGQRSLCNVGPDGQKRGYGLMLMFPGGDAEAAAKMLDKLAEGFEFITEYPPNTQIVPPGGAPQSEPAPQESQTQATQEVETQPAEEPLPPAPFLDPEK